MLTVTVCIALVSTCKYDNQFCVTGVTNEHGDKEPDLLCAAYILQTKCSLEFCLAVSSLFIL